MKKISKEDVMKKSQETGSGKNWKGDYLKETKREGQKVER